MQQRLEALRLAKAAACPSRPTEPEEPATGKVSGAAIGARLSVEETMRFYGQQLPAREFEAIQAWSRTFYPFQREWLFEQARFALCNKARQIGMSHTTGGVAVLWGAYHAETTSIISLGEREADEVVEKSRWHIGRLKEFGSRWSQVQTRGGVLHFPNGGRIMALPSSSGGRGFSGNVYLDEFAYLKHPDKIWDGAAAVTMHGYRMRVTSTPNGVGDAFHALVTDPKRNAGWVKFEFPLKRALEEGMNTINLDACWTMAHGDPRLFAQLFECSFLDGQDQYIPTELILEAAHDETFVPEGDVFAGLDIGLTNDLSSLTIVRQAPDGSVWEQETRTCKRTDWDEQMRIIALSYENWGWKRLCVDSSGLGLVPAQMLQKVYGRQRVEPIVFSNPMKETLATTLYQGFADGMLFILNDKTMINDLCSLRRTVTDSGAIRFDAPRTPDGHADRAWSLALALHACSQRIAGLKTAGPGQYEGST